MIAKNINCFVDVVGNSPQHIINGMFDVVENIDAKVTLNINGNQIVLNEDNEKDYLPTSVTGIINKTEDNPISGVRVSFIKDNILMDYSVTDNNGKYSVFVPPGNYTIKVSGQGCNDTYKDQEIDSNIVNFSYTIDSLVLNKYNDVVEFYNIDKKMITGIMMDENNKPIEDVEILISNGDTLVAYEITDSKGKYNFCIQEGKYDIRMRSKNSNVKIFKNYQFDKTKGFIAPLQNQSIIFKRGEWVWIYN